MFQLRQSMMIGAVLVALGSATLLPSLGRAQEATPTNANQPATISVQGEGIVRLAPDAATTTIGVTVSDTALTTAQSSANEAMTAVIDALKAGGVADEDIQTSNYSVQPMQSYDDMGNPTGITQFQVSNQVSVVIRDIESIPSLLDSAVAAGANTIWGISFIATDAGDAIAQARQLAVADAQVRAEQLASAAGMNVGAIISIVESSSPAAFSDGKGGGAFAAESASVPIEGGSSEIRVSVQIVYELV